MNTSPIKSYLISPSLRPLRNSNIKKRIGSSQSKIPDIELFDTSTDLTTSFDDQKPFIPYNKQEHESSFNSDKSHKKDSSLVLYPDKHQKSEKLNSKKLNVQGLGHKYKIKLVKFEKNKLKEMHKHLQESKNFNY